MEVKPLPLVHLLVASDTAPVPGLLRQSVLVRNVQGQAICHPAGCRPMRHERHQRPQLVVGIPRQLELGAMPGVN
jgi:hypothetical protein